MRIAVIAAGGRTGRVFVRAALEAGHIVTAGVRAPDTFSEELNLHVQTCDATNLHDVEQLLQDQDAVVSLIGHGRHSPPDLQTKTIQNVLSAMESQGVNRVVSLTGTGVRFTNDEITLWDRLLNVSIALIDPKRIKDGIRHADILKESATDWTLLRVLKLTNTNKGDFKLSRHGPVEPLTSRRQVAAAIVDILESNSYIKSAPIMSRYNDEKNPEDQ